MRAACADVSASEDPLHELVVQQGKRAIIGADLLVMGAYGHSRLREFLSVFRLYAKHNPPPYAARIAWGVAFRGLPF